MLSCNRAAVPTVLRRCFGPQPFNANTEFKLMTKQFVLSKAATTANSQRTRLEGATQTN